MWETFDLAMPHGAKGLFKVTPDKVEAGSESVRRQFFQVLAPEPEIFSVQPAVVAVSGDFIYIIGQCFPSNAAVYINDVLQTNTTWLDSGLLRVQVTFDPPPPGQIAPPQNVRVNTGEFGNRIAELSGAVTLGSDSAVNQRLLEVADEPPGSPFFKSVGGLKMETETTDYQEGGISTHGSTHVAVRHFSGELTLSCVDLSVPGRGLDFTWVRTYRSRTGASTPSGQGWSHSYDIRAFLDAGGVVIVLDGTGRSDKYFLETNGVYTANELFNEGALANGLFTLTFPDTGRWEFNSLSNAIAPGKISRSVDRNGNALTFTYDASGRLAEIIDTLDRTNTIAYLPRGNRILSVTDFSGRSVVYAYYRQGEAGGGNGDLKSVRSPLVIGTPNTNDFPLGKMTTYTYTMGFADDRLNHNLLTITDPLNQTWMHAEYSPTTDPLDVNFDRVTSCSRGFNPPSLFTYVPPTLTPSNHWAVMKTIRNDPVGNVTIDWFDSLNRNIIHRDLAARAVPGTTLTESNLPTVKLRDSDPDFWETRCTWNLDSLCTRVQWPEGNSDECVYERDFHPDCSARHKADIRVLREVACCVGDLNGDGLPDRITSYFQHDPRFGSRKIGEGNPWLGDISSAMGFSTSGKLIGVWGSTHSKPRTEANARFGNGPRQTLPLDGSYPHSDAKIIVDRDTGRSKGFGFVISSTDPRGNVDHADYDAQGNCTRLAHEGRLLDASYRPVNSFEYNFQGQLTATVNPADANGFTRRDEITYYDSGAQNGYMREWRVDATGPEARNTSFDYDAVGNVAQLVDPRGNTNRWIYNALDQVVKTKEPDLQCSGCIGYERAFFYDASDNLVRVEQDDRDFNGAANTNKATWTTFYDYDELNRCRLLAHEVTHTVQQNGAPPVAARYVTNRFVYDGLNNVIESHSPEAVNGNQPANFVRYEYDTRNLPFRTTRAPGSADGSTSQWGYDGNGRCVRAEHGAGGGSGGAVLLYTYDSLGLVVTATDSLGNTGTSTRNANGALVYTQRAPRGSVGGVACGDAAQPRSRRPSRRGRAR